MFVKTMKSVFQEVSQVYLTLLKVMVPAIIVVKILDLLGGTQWLAEILAPVMKFVGLPEQLGLVWATAILTNIFTAMVVFVDTTAQLELSVAQVSVIGLLILISHSVPIEGAVAKMVGVSWRLTISLKIGGGLLLAALVNWLYTAMDYQQQAAVLLWQHEIKEQTLIQWGLDQLQMLISIFFIISALIILLRILKKIGVESLLQKLLSPIFKLLSITKDASNITITGITLGLSYGAGLLISEIKKGHIGKKDVLLSISFLSLAHSLIEDTLLILLLGADVIAILWLRIIFAIVIVALLAKYIAIKESIQLKALTKPQ
ncbi:nucleoside recognition domain-containing protein [Colwellia psychrerythraea]|uniref:Putative membrane protein n=1 Tax=Colwellia psychrerythraea (strain 34H / ATCC BAA-681) TaxID=167879 RepID=Q485X7_COLP3|nr:nucleoside recognition domain-containing protein [Colwellia psychrerythraea]AAZ28723.1 putative membrane protein [Colwellia psychrerythraea 34H]